jgi:predicted amidophosphoribosyltransferase
VVLDFLLPARWPSSDADLDLRPPPSLPPPPGVDRCVAATAYEDAGRTLVAALKFRAESSAVRFAARALAVRLDVAGLDVVTWAPTTGRRRRRRGGDHAERLARAVAAEVGLPCRRLLLRRPGPAQAGQGAAGRRRGPPLAAARRAPRGVLLVDDVVTTGGTVAAAAKVLRDAGASVVVVACAARTPRPHRGLS